MEAGCLSHALRWMLQILHSPRYLIVSSIAIILIVIMITITIMIIIVIIILIVVTEIFIILFLGNYGASNSRSCRRFGINSGVLDTCMC